MDMEQFRSFVVMAWSILCNILNPCIQRLDEGWGRCERFGTCYLSCHALKNFKKQIEQLKAMLSGCLSWAEIREIASLHQNIMCWLQETCPDIFRVIMELFIQKMDNNSCDKDISLVEERRICCEPFIDLNRTRNPRIRIRMDELLNPATSDGRSNDVQETVDPTAAQVESVQMKIKMAVKSSDIRPEAPTNSLRDAHADAKGTSHYVDVINTPLPIANFVDQGVEHTEHEDPEDLSQPALPEEPKREPDSSARVIDDQTNKPERQTQAHGNTASEQLADVESHASGQSENRWKPESIVVVSTATPVLPDGTKSIDEKPLAASNDTETTKVTTQERKRAVEQIASNDLKMEAVPENRVSNDLATTEATPRRNTHALMMRVGKEKKAATKEDSERKETNEPSMAEATMTSKRGVPPGVDWRTQQPVNTVDVDEKSQLKPPRDNDTATKESSDLSVKNLNVMLDTTEDDEG